MPDLIIDVPSLGGLPAYFSPTSQRQDGRAPGVVVLHEAFGLTEDIRDIADQFSARGYDALAPNLLSYGGQLRCMVSVFRALQAGAGRPFAEITASRLWLAERADSTGHVGIAGFCLGGAFALVMANRGFQASAAQYGRLPKNLAGALAGACPVVASYGGRDGTLTGAAQRLEEALQAAGVPHDVKEYPEAGHSFMNHSQAPGWMRPLTGSMNAGYVDTAAADAWERIDALFSSALRPEAGSS